MVEYGGISRIYPKNPSNHCNGKFLDYKWRIEVNGEFSSMFDEGSPMNIFLLVVYMVLYILHNPFIINRIHCPLYWGSRILKESKSGHDIFPIIRPWRLSEDNDGDDDY